MVVYLFFWERIGNVVRKGFIVDMLVWVGVFFILDLCLIVFLMVKLGVLILVFV